METQLQKPPEWADSRHIGKDGGPYYCSHCFEHEDEQHEVEVVKTRALAGWHGVNWKDGFEEVVKCPGCGFSGRIKTIRMDKSHKGPRFHREGVAARPSGIEETP